MGFVESIGEKAIVNSNKLMDISVKIHGDAIMKQFLTACKYPPFNATQEAFTNYCPIALEYRGTEKGEWHWHNGTETCYTFSVWQHFDVTPAILSLSLLLLFSKSPCCLCQNGASAVESFRTSWTSQVWPKWPLTLLHWSSEVLPSPGIVSDFTLCRSTKSNKTIQGLK